MGGNPSQTNSEDDDFSKFAKKKNKKNKNKKIAARFSEFSKLKFEMFNDIKDIEKYENYGILPVHVIHDILQFLEPFEHLQATLSSKLFMLVGNTRLFWKQYCLNQIDHEYIKKKEKKLQLELEEEEEKRINWKKLFFEHRNTNFFFKKEKYYIERYKELGWKKDYESIYSPKPPLEGSSSRVPFKLALLGRTGCGKSSLTLRFVRNEFFPKQESTIGAAFLTNGIGPVKLEIWDTSGQERYESLAPMYFRGAQIVILGFSITTTKNLFKESMEKWIKLLSDNDYMDRVLLVGLRKDLEDQRKISKLEASQVAWEAGMMGYVECSSKSGDGVYRVFGILAEFLEKRAMSEITSSLKKNYDRVIKL